MQPVSRQRIGKHIPTATNTHSTTEELVSKQQIGEHTTIEVDGNGVSSSVHAKWS
jgi:hypothetical protein